MLWLFCNLDFTLCDSYIEQVWPPLIYVNAVIVKVVECNIFKKTNSLCDVKKGRSSSICSPREISTSFPGNLHFFIPR